MLPADCPPPLQSLAQQVQAVQITQGGKESGQLSGADVQVATTTVIGAPKAPAPLRRGFFDAKPTAGPKRRPAGAASAAASAASAGPDITVVRAQQRDAGRGPSIPDFMRLPPDEQHERYQVTTRRPRGRQGRRAASGNPAARTASVMLQAPGCMRRTRCHLSAPCDPLLRPQALKSNMVKALQPTPDMVQQVAKDETLMAGEAGGQGHASADCQKLGWWGHRPAVRPGAACAARAQPQARQRSASHHCPWPPAAAGFDDPKVMAAVSEVARDPAAIQKYRNNKKVRPRQVLAA